jgi:hypothetical protein
MSVAADRGNGDDSPLADGWLSGKYRKGQEVSGSGSAARAARAAVTTALEAAFRRR